MLDPSLLSTAMLSFAALRYDPGIPLASDMFTSMAINLPLFEGRDLVTTAQVTSLMRSFIVCIRSWVSEGLAGADCSDTLLCRNCGSMQASG